MDYSFKFTKGTSPIVATAIHEGHCLRDELSALSNLSGEERLREEDPFTAKWLNISDNTIIVHHSRFETDVNRPRNKAIYLKPQDAWGLKVWKEDLSQEIIGRSLAIYNDFYQKAQEYFDSLFELHDKIVVYDIHSYNHRREDAHAIADARENPEVNIGTKNIENNIWQPISDVMIQSFQSFDYNGRRLDVRENIKFKGGYFGQWLHEKYGKNICPVSIEFKKFFMDEWTGEPFEEDIRLISELVIASREPVLEELKNIKI